VKSNTDAENNLFLDDLLDILEPKEQQRYNPDIKLSLCMIVKDEEEFIENCLKSVQNVVDEIIIVDTGSTDKTIELAKKYTDKIFYHEWQEDFSAARNESLKHATGDWILILDADEELSLESQKNLRLLLTKPMMPTYFQLLIKSYSSNKDANSFEHYMARFFTNFYDIKYKGKIHEQLSPMMSYPILISGELIFIIHHGYREEIIKKKDKFQKRSLPMLVKEMEENSALDSFHSFNIGNLTMDPEKSTKYFEDSIDKLSEGAVPAYINVAYWKLIKGLVLCKKYEEAINIAKKALKKSPTIIDYADFWEGFAHAYLYKGDYQVAIEYFEKAIETRKDNTSIAFAIGRTGFAGTWTSWYNMGLAYWHLANFTKSKECLLKTIELNPNNIYFYWQAVNACLECSDYVTAEELYNRMLKIAPIEKNKIHSDLSNLYLRQENIEECLKIQKDLYGEDIVKNNALKLADTYERGNRLDIALRTYSCLIDFFPDYIEPYCKKTELYRDMGQFVNAMNEIETAKQKCAQKEDTDSMNRVGSIFLSLKELIAAEECFKWILSIKPDDYEGNLYMAYIAQIKENYAEAQRILENLIINNPLEVKAYIQLGNLLVGLNNFIYAEKIFKQTTELNPSSYYPHYALGIAQLSLGKFAAANTALRLALKINPDDINIKNALELLHQNN